MEIHKLFLAFGLGLVVFLICLGLVMLSFPFILGIMPFIAIISAGFLGILIASLIIWAIVYGLILLGIITYYMFKPMKINKKKSNYSIKTIKESGRRSKK